MGYGPDNVGVRRVVEVYTLKTRTRYEKTDFDRREPSGTSEFYCRHKDLNRRRKDEWGKNLCQSRVPSTLPNRVQTTK